MAPTTRQSIRAGLTSMRKILPASLNETAGDPILEPKDSDKFPEDHATNETKQQSSTAVKKEFIKFKVAKLGRKVKRITKKPVGYKSCVVKGFDRAKSGWACLNTGGEDVRVDWEQDLKGNWRPYIRD